MTDHHLFFKDWRAADEAARAAETEVLRATLAALDGRGRPPSLRERADAKQLRQLANELFEAAMIQVTAKRKGDGKRGSSA